MFRYLESTNSGFERKLAIAPESPPGANWFTVFIAENGGRNSFLLRCLAEAALGRKRYSPERGNTIHFFPSGDLPQQVIAMSGTPLDRFPRMGTQLIRLCLASVALVGGLAGCGAALPFRPEVEAQKAAQERYAKAKALFEERCKSAGVVVKRTVKDVEGIELLKVRSVLTWGDQRYFDPMFDGAAMADEAQSDSFIASFLYNELRNPNTPAIRGVIQPPAVQVGMNQQILLQGYRYVDVQDRGSPAVLRYRIAPSLTEGQWYERGGWAKDLERIVWTGPRAPFAVDYEDIVDPADRAYWIAGTRIKIVDQESGEIIAQLTRFVWDRAFGASSTGRWPWQHASSRTSNICPSDTSLPRSYVTRYFVDTVLIPKQGD